MTPFFSARALAVLALGLNAVVWGTSWWPFRRLESAGLHPLWATTLVFGLSGLVLLALRPRAAGQVARTPALWILVFAAGTTNAAFNWGVVIGDVVRVVLLFYLMPLWAVLLARIVLHERLTPIAALRIVLGLAGAAIVLWPVGAGAGALPLPDSLADWLGVLGGFTFALNNVMLKREAARPEEGRAFAMFVGGALVPALLGLVLGTVDPGFATAPPFAWSWFAIAIALAAVFLASNLALQYGAARLPANLTAVVMLTEVLVASASSVAFGGAVLTARLVIGGLLILSGAVLAAVGPKEPY